MSEDKFQIEVKRREQYHFHRLQIQLKNVLTGTNLFCLLLVYTCMYAQVTELTCMTDFKRHTYMYIEPDSGYAAIIIVHVHVFHRFTVLYYNDTFGLNHQT